MDLIHHHKTKEMDVFSKAINKFGMKLYEKLATSTSDNLLISPYCVFSSLMLTMLGTGGSSENEIMAALGVSDVSKNVHSEFRRLQFYIRFVASGCSKFSEACRIFAKSGLEVKRDFKFESVSKYSSELEFVDFLTDAEESRRKINTWMKNKTNNKIKYALPQKCIDQETLLLLVNAVYFKSKWAETFREVVKKEFNVFAGKAAEIDMMVSDKRKCFVAVNDEMNCKILEIPYKEGQISMVLILPNEIDGIFYLEQKLFSKNKLQGLTSTLREQEVNVALPKFTMETSCELKYFLEAVGITHVFSRDVADFSGMFKESDAKSNVNEIIHSACVEISEGGVESPTCTSMKDAKEEKASIDFIADRPFLYYIQEKETETILFIARFMGPKRYSQKGL